MSLFPLSTALTLALGPLEELSIVDIYDELAYIEAECLRADPAFIEMNFIERLFTIASSPYFFRYLTFSSDGGHIIWTGKGLRDYIWTPSTLTRHLNFYGFKRITDSRKRKQPPIFQHPYFHRDQPHLIHFINRNMPKSSPK